MGLETGTWVDDLVITNPPGGDDKRQGDDHLRLIKTVLRNTLKRAAKAFYLPVAAAKSANYAVLESDENTTFQCDTTVAFTLTLPVLDSTRAGWQINVVKATTDMNPVFLVPSSGTINGFAKVRRSIAASITQVMWTGSIWVASRPLGTPIGSVTEYYGTSLPQGHLWADGSLINAATFVEASAILGANVPDKRGRIGVGRDDMGGTPAGLITFAVSGLDGLTLKAIGGAQSVVMDRTNLPNVALSHSLTWSGSGSWTQGLTTATFSGNPTGPLFSDNNDWLRAPVGGSANPGGTGVIGSATSGSVSLPGITPTGSVSVGMLGSVAVSGSIGGSLGSLNGAVAQTAMRNIQPSIICNMIVVAE